MKQFFKMFFASLAAMIVAGVIVVGVVVGLIVSAVSDSVKPETKIQVDANSVLVLDMKKTFHEQSQTNSLAAFSSGDMYSTGLYDATMAIQKAKEDGNIKGILLKLSETPNGWATLQQLRNALKDFKSSGKFIYAYGENITQGAYYVGTVADSIYLNPVGDMELKGFAATLAFFKGTLNKLELEPEIFYAGKFKSATEPFREEKMSEPNRLQVSEFISDYWNEFLGAVAQHTGADTATVHQWAATGAIQFPKDAVDRKLVNGLLYWDEVESRIRKKTDTDEDENIKYISINDYADHARKGRKGKDDRIAVLMAEGGIVSNSSNEDYEIAADDIIKVIRKLRKNEKVKAVVLRVNSPGGSAFASEEILRELQLLKAKKPLVVSMGNVAASGGYYIACQADSIFAMPNTITGSIGVFTMMFNVSNLMKNKLGVTFDGVRNTPYADFPSGVRTLTEDERARMQAQVNNIYDIFKSRVAAGRKMTVENVDSIAQGRVWTGTDALAIGLVDGLGDLDRAILSASRLAKLKDYQVTTYPEPTDRLEMFFKKINDNDASAEAMKAAIQKEMIGELDFVKQIKQLRTMNGKAMMALPYSIDIR
jgi:protease IV